MTIFVYPSQLPGEPLETHQHHDTTIGDWLSAHVTGYQPGGDQPILVEVNGAPVPPAAWAQTAISAADVVRICPVPRGSVVAWIAIGVAVASAAYSVFMMRKMKTASAPGSGDQIDLSPAKANRARLGAPVREIFGRYRVYPDYLVQPVSRFVDETRYETNVFLCVGVGQYEIASSGIRIGATPAAAFGDDVSYTIYPPGADVSGDPRSECWYDVAEVGGTAAGTAGLDLGSSGPQTVSVQADAVYAAGDSLSLIGAQSSGESPIPPAWQPGTVIDAVLPDSYRVQTQDGYSVLYGDFSELTPAPGLAVTLRYGENCYDLTVRDWSPFVPPVPGTGGTPASIQASAAPAYDFTDSPVTFALGWQGERYTISLVTDYQTLDGLCETITSQLTGSGLVAQGSGGRVLISESASPYAGGTISSDFLPAAVFGDSPDVVAGLPSSGGRPAVPEHLTLCWDSGEPFAGLPDGARRLAIDVRDSQYRIVDVDGLTLRLERVISDGQTVTADPAWPGFRARTLLDATITGVNDDYDWCGPFLSCPDGETTDRLELNFLFAGGLIRYDSRGNRKTQSVTVIVQYRRTTESDWTETSYTWARRTEDQIGFTVPIDVPRGQYLVRMRRRNPVRGGSTRDQAYWQALRSRLATRPARYPDVTTIALTVRTGNRLASQSDRQISVVATRLYPDQPTRSISGALYHVLRSVGFRDDQIDAATIASLEAQHWTPRGETFDWSTGDSQSAIDVLQKICGAGGGYFLLSDGLASAGREGVKPWVGAITPQEMVEELKTNFTAPSADDYDGVDVTYTDGTRWTDEVITCRTPDNPTPQKIEQLTLDGVTDRTRAWRLGMRRLLGHRLQRLSHSTTTELDALCYQYMDRILLTDDIPGSQTLSCLVTAVERQGDRVLLTLSEPPDWTWNNPRAVIRRQDGSATGLLVPARVDEFTLSVPYSAALGLEGWTLDDPATEPLRLIFCTSQRVGYSALISDITPGTDCTCQISAVQYVPEKYQCDDSQPPN